MVLSGGLKPPLSCFLFTGSTKKEMAWQCMVGWFKLRAYFFVLHHNICFLYIIFIVQLYYKRAWMAQLVGNVAGRYWDLGSIPRSPHIIVDFCFKTFTCSNDSMVHHAPPCASLPSGHDAQSSGQEMESMVCSSQWTCTRSGKSTRPCANGPEFLKVHLHMGQTPPWFAIFFLFLYSFILFLLICFNYY